MTEHDYVDNDISENNHQDAYQDETIVYHSMARIITTTVLLALIAGVCLTIGMEFFTTDVDSKRELLEASVKSYLPLGIASIVSICFLRYLFKATQRFLYT